ncbi:biotin/lipoyl-containing protein [Geotalea toluenoxydans]|uniref:biotin/lipoyl-containing protein n=1 Tax=Geotalea toluenoxydans TaxID=421624 RepID=UPI000ABE91D3
MEIKVPAVGESITEALVAKWHKLDGERVEKDEIICEIETDKITLEINADAAGTLAVRVGEGETVQIGAVIGTIDEKGAAEQVSGPAKHQARKKKKQSRSRRFLRRCGRWPRKRE